MFGDMSLFEFNIIKSNNLRVLCLAGNNKFSMFISDSILWYVVVQCVVGVVVLIQSRPSRVSSIVKSAKGCVELVTKD